LAVAMILMFCALDEPLLAEAEPVFAPMDVLEIPPPLLTAILDNTPTFWDVVVPLEDDEPPLSMVA